MHSGAIACPHPAHTSGQDFADGCSRGVVAVRPQVPGSGADRGSGSPPADRPPSPSRRVLRAPASTARAGGPIGSVSTVSARYAATCAESIAARSVGIGMLVREVSDFSGSAGYCTVGWTIPRMKSTSDTRWPHASASRSPANAPSRIVARRCSGMASWSCQTCSFVATCARCFSAPGDVRREHGDRGTIPSCTASENTCASRACSA